MKVAMIPFVSIKELIDHIDDLCDSLEAEVQARYPGEHPIEVRRRTNDLEEVVRGRALAEMHRAQLRRQGVTDVERPAPGKPVPVP